MSRSINNKRSTWNIIQNTNSTHTAVKALYGITVYSVIMLCSCLHQKTTPATNLHQLLNRLQYKTPNELYNAIGDPDEYRIFTNNTNQTTHALITYKYIYNFKKNTYDCIISFKTNNTQDKIISFETSSSTCEQILLP